MNIHQKRFSRCEIGSTDSRTGVRGGKDCDMACEMLFRIEPSRGNELRSDGASSVEFLDFLFDVLTGLEG